MPTEVGVPLSLLGDSEATLRQVQGVLDDFGDFADLGRRIPSEEDGGSVPDTSARGAEEGTQEIDSGPMGQLRHIRSRLLEAALTTQSAASRMLDGLDRSLVLIDDIESEPDHDGERAFGLRNELREELHQLLGMLQFQDITAQQLGYASKIVGELEERVAWAAEGFDVGVHAIRRLHDSPTRPGSGSESSCDPRASTRNAAGRQALADSVFE